MAQAVKKLPAVQKIDIQNLGWEDPLENWMATHSSILAWKIPWAEEPGGLQSTGWQRVGHDWATNTFTFHFPALEKEMATHSSVLARRIPGTGEPGGLPSMGLQSWTRLKRLSSSSVLIRKGRDTPELSLHLVCPCSEKRPFETKEVI